MNRLKTNRILWTIAILLVLSLVAVMVLHKDEKPEIIGSFSPEDISAISKASRRSERLYIKRDMKRDLKTKQIMSLMLDVGDYFFIRVLSIDNTSPGDVHVRVQPKSGRTEEGYYLKKNGANWKVVGFDKMNGHPLN